MFDQLGVKLRTQTLDLGGRQNRNPRPTVISDQEREELAAVLARLPASYLEIFRREPYAGMAVLDCLRKAL